ncbi:MAG: FHA domain-containing protein [Planctomycetes bacterium]|nr:FHA domain-containing protein [Planctomycetota bacterium]MCW8136988.1 FHA domain-containing protein [Planctomycetota bacterium]
MSEVLTIKLTGIAGFCKGSEFVIEEGGEVVIGRSRNAGLRIAGPDHLSEPPSDKPFKGHGDKEKHLLTVSGRHVKLTFQNAKAIFIEDLSKHGTFLDGKPVEGRDQIIGLKKGPIELRLGTNETFRMELLKAPAKPKPKITVKRRD